MVEGQFMGRQGDTAVLAGESVAQENIEPGEGRLARLRDVFLERNDAWQAQLERRRANRLLILGDHVDPVGHDRFDGFLPGQ